MNQRREPPWGVADTTPTEIIGDLANPEFGARRPALEEVVNTVLLGRFELVEFIVEGGMSGVYKAVDRRRVAGRADDPHVAGRQERAR